MAATLALIFTERPRLLPLALAGLATALTFGGLALVGAPLTMASIAVLPVLVGLSVDYAIQFQARVGETEPVPGDPGGPHRPRGGPRRAHDRDRGRRQLRGDPRAAAVAGADGAGLLGAAGRRPGFALLCTLTAGAARSR